MDARAAVVAKKESRPGPKGKYESHVLPRLNEIYEWVVQGYTDYSIADNLGICHESLIKYKSDNLELSSLYTRARTERNRLVMNRMFAKACGETAQVKQEKLTKEGAKVTLVSEIYTPPDVNAADLFLRNNDPNYKGQKHIDSGNITINNIQIPQLQDEIKRIEEQRKALEMQLSQGVWKMEE